MKKRRLKIKPYLLVLGLLWIPCNVFAGLNNGGSSTNTGSDSGGMNQFAQTTGTELGNIATNLQGQPQSSWPGIIAADVGAMNGVTIDGFGNITVNAWVMGNYAVGPQPAPNLNIYDAGAWKAFNPGQSLMDQYRGGCDTGNCACGETCGSLSQCTDSCSGHLVMLTEIRYIGTTPVREPGCLTRGGYSIIYGYHYQCIYNGGGTCGINYWYYGQFPVVMKAMGHQDNTDWYYENRYINQEYGGLIRNIYCNRGGPKRCKPDGGPVLLHTGTCENWIYPKVANTYVNPTTSSSNAVNVDPHMEV